MFDWKFSYNSFVNLDHRSDRLIHMQNELKKVRLEATRSRGIYPNEIKGDTKIYDKMLNRTKGAAGCHLAQVSVMKRALEMQMNAFVMEDDLIFCNDFRERMGYVQNFLNKYDPDFDVIWLGGTVHINPPQWHTGINPDLITANIGRDAERTPDKRIIRTYGAFCTYAYIVNVNSLGKVIKMLEDNVHTSMGIDWLFIKLQPQLRTYMFLPGMIKQMDNQSDIGNGITKFSGFEKLGPYWYQDKMENFNPDNFNFNEANVLQKI